MTTVKVGRQNIKTARNVLKADAMAILARGVVDMLAELKKPESDSAKAKAEKIKSLIKKTVAKLEAAAGTTRRSETSP